MTSQNTFTVCEQTLPEYWMFGRAFRGQRISTLPFWYLSWVVTWPNLPALDRAAVRAELGFWTLAGDQAKGRH